MIVSEFLASAQFFQAVVGYLARPVRVNVDAV